MLRYVHTLSAVLFYLLGSSFFLAYLLVHNGIAAAAAGAWLSIGDLPLLLSGLLYGGISVYRSIRNDASSTPLMLGIGIPVIILFILFLTLNFL